MDKRGISGVVVTILIVLVAVIAVNILWMALKPSIEQTAGKIGAREECLYLDLEIEDLNSTSVKVFRDTGEASLKEIKIIINGAEVARETEIPEVFETKTYDVALSSGDVVKIAGVLEDGTICSISDTKTAE